MESQAWWIQTPGKTGTTFGHMHVGACLPTEQTISGVIGIDVRIILHDNPGHFDYWNPVLVSDDQELSLAHVTDLHGLTCPSGTCTQWSHADVDTRQLNYDGRQELRIRAYTNTPDGNIMHSSINAFLVLANGRTVNPLDRLPFQRGKGWYTGSGYCEASFVSKISYAPVSGIWSPVVKIENHNEAGDLSVTHHTIRIDPDFHAIPPVPGTIINDGPGQLFQTTINIDTTTLANGLHHLHMRADCDDPRGSTNSGVLVIPFIVSSGTTQVAHLTLTKSVDNTGGGTAPATAWTLGATGPTPIAGTTGDAAITNAPVAPGTYTLAESGGPAGYTAGAWSCTGGTLAGSSLVLAAGDTASCSITNTFVPPSPAHLTLTKSVDNTGGGTAPATAWTLGATGPTPIAGTTGDAAITNAPVAPGTYTLAESGGPAGYTAGAWSCTGGTLAGSSLVLAAGDTASCSITNTFVPPSPAHLTLTKSVANTGGGTAPATAWTLGATGPTPIAGTTGDAAITNAPVAPGTYTLAESGGPAGYTAGAWSCTGGTLAGSSLVLAAGDTASCSITNTFVPPSPAHLTLTKSVANTGGGTAPATAWTLGATGPTPIAGTTGDAAITNAPVAPGTYTLAESGGPAGYTAGAWSCTGGTLAGSSLVLAAGDTASCSITNTFVPPEPGSPDAHQERRQHRRRDGARHGLDPRRDRAHADRRHDR